MGVVYKLICPKTSTLVYVGSTTKPLIVRYKQHLKDIQHSESPIYRYFRENDITPMVRVIERINDEIELRDREKYWIKRYGGSKLFNRAYNRGETRVVRVSRKIISRVKLAIEGTNLTIGEFFELAAEEKLKRESK